MDRQRDRILIDAEPTVESETDIQQITTSDNAKLYLLFAGVCAVSMNAVRVANQKADDRIVHVVMKARHHAQG